MIAWLGLFFSLFAFVISFIAAVYVFLARKELQRDTSELEDAEQKLIEVIGLVGRLARRLDAVSKNNLEMH